MRFQTTLGRYLPPPTWLLPPCWHRKHEIYYFYYKIKVIQTFPKQSFRINNLCSRKGAVCRRQCTINSPYSHRKGSKKAWHYYGFGVKLARLPETIISIFAVKCKIVHINRISAFSATYLQLTWKALACRPSENHTDQSRSIVCGLWFGLRLALAFGLRFEYVATPQSNVIGRSLGMTFCGLHAQVCPKTIEAKQQNNVRSTAEFMYKLDRFKTVLASVRGALDRPYLYRECRGWSRGDHTRREGVQGTGLGHARQLQQQRQQGNSRMQRQPLYGQEYHG